MRLYIDKENLLSYLSQKKDKRYLFCTILLQNQLDITFNFAKKEGLKDDTIQHFLASFSEGAGFEETKRDFLDTEKSFPSRPIKGNLCSSLSPEQLSSVYLINDEKVNHLKSQGYIMIGGIGEELDLLGSLWYEDYQFSTPKSIDEITSWKDLDSYINPCMDIVMIDGFIFKDATLLKSNLYPLINVLSSKGKLKRVNVVIVSTEMFQTGEIRTSYETVLKELKKSIEATTGIKPNVTIATLPQNDRRHDRHVITNYNRFTSGDSFVYLGSDGSQISRGDDVSIISLASQTYKRQTDKILGKVQERLNKISKGDRIIGDKISNLLQF